MENLRLWLRRAALSVLARRRGEVRAAQDLRQLGEVARLSGVFAATMLFPIGFLAFLSLTSLRTEEASFDKDLEHRGQEMVRQIRGEIQSIFDRFEQAADERISDGESPLSNLGELSPYLRGAFRFDEDGRLAAPFLLLSDEEPEIAPLGWQRAARAARALEAQDPARAAEAWRASRQASPIPRWIGESMLGEARTLHAAGRPPEVYEDVLLELMENYSTERDRHGFRFGDLAMLEIGRHRLERGERETAAELLVTLVDGLLASPWTIGEDGEPTLAREALRLLEGHHDADWIARSRTRLNELHAQLYWAELVKNEIELVYSKLPDNQVRYVGAHTEASPGVWAIVRGGGNTYAFSFSVSELVEELEASVAKQNALDRDLIARLHDSDEPLPSSTLADEPLGPWLLARTVSVQPKDPLALAASKNRRRTVRVAIVFTAVFVAVVGALWLARMIATEVENARQRADFAANVSHELRSPITQIRLKGEALQLGLVEPGEDMQQHFDAIVREAERLSRLVDNVLDFAAIERGAKSYQLRREDLAAAVLTSVEAARLSLEQAGMALELDIQDDLPPVWIDREAIGQVLTNLLSNAVKYGAEGKWVRVRVHQVGPRVELSVSDRGIGIVPEDLPRVFDDFFRSTDPNVRRTKGTGIGLAIVRYIVEAHGGTIGVESSPGRGTRFTVHLPLEAPVGAGDRN
jgi:signal transduction histidine kinase